jgi:DNA polymerase-3 subunit beta
MNEKLKSPVSCSVIDDCMKISCKTSLGAIDEEITVSVKSGEFTEPDSKNFNIYFNPRFMLEALQKTYCDEVNICFNGNLNPFKITPLDDNGEFIFIIVPIRSS